MIVGKGAYRINLEKNVTPRFCFFKVLRLPRGALLLTVKQAIDIIRGTKGVFVTNVKAITKGEQSTLLIVASTFPSAHTPLLPLEGAMILLTAYYLSIH